MKTMIQDYIDARAALTRRRDELAESISEYDRRMVLLESEIDEINEVLCTLRKYDEP